MSQFTPEQRNAKSWRARAQLSWGLLLPPSVRPSRRVVRSPNSSTRPVLQIMTSARGPESNPFKRPARPMMTKKKIRPRRATRHVRAM